MSASKRRLPRSSTTVAERSGHAAPALLFFGGKGGTGKTTCAAGRAIAEARRGRRVLVLSTDPAHSLGDTLGIRLTSRPSRIVSRRRGGLAGLELDGPRAFRAWLVANRRALGDILEHGTWLEREDIDGLLELPIPGIDELMALVEIARLAASGPRSHSYDLIVVDTAPTGHMLRLIAAPHAVAAVSEALDALQEEHRLIRSRFGRIGRPERADLLIETIARQAREASALLTDRSRCSFCLVTLPEQVALAETADALDALRKAGVSVAEIIVNRMLPEGPPCPLCDPRRAMEWRALDVARRMAPAHGVRAIAARLKEPRGVRALGAVGEELMKVPRSRRPPAVRRPRARGQRGLALRGGPPERLAAFAGARLLLFGGKGGVGKTTCSAAVALRLAEAEPQRRVLLLSTDPAHSLGDVLGVALDDEPRAVSATYRNLFARELDAARALAARRAEIESAVGEIAQASEPTAVRARGVGELMDLAPPGIDELLGVISVAESLGLDDDTASEEARSGSFDLVVCDTAPTGHALKLLAMPEAARDWVRALLRVLLKYRKVVRPGGLAQKLVELSRSIRRLQSLLGDRRQSRFIAVTRAAEVPRLETRRLIASVRGLSWSVPAIIVNAATIDPGDCQWCRTVAAAERSVTTQLRQATGQSRGRCAIILAPLVAPPPSGVNRLHDWAATWKLA